MYRGGNEPPIEHQNTNCIVHIYECVVCTDTWKSHQPIFLWWGQHYKQFIPGHVGKLCSSVALWQQYHHTTTLIFNWMENLFIWLILSVNDYEFPRLMDGKRTNCMPLILLILWLELVSLGLCERPGVQPKSEYAGWTQKCRCYKGYIIQHIWQEVDCNWDVCRATDAAHCEVFRTKQLFHLCLKNPIDEQNTGNNIPNSVFTPKLYVRLHLCTLMSFCTMKNNHTIWMQKSDRR
jgi:hypothetical protein